MDDGLTPAQAMVAVRAHPIWQATTGSELIFQLRQPPESHVRSLHLSVCSIAKPTTYKLYFDFSDGQRTPSQYLKRKEALAVIKREWVRYYHARTRLLFIEHTCVDLKSLMDTAAATTHSSSGDEQSPRTCDSGTATPTLLSPRVVRGMPRFTPPQSPRHSPRTSSPRDWLFGRRRSLGSNTPSPRGSPRAVRFQ